MAEEVLKRERSAAEKPMSWRKANAPVASLKIERPLEIPAASSVAAKHVPQGHVGIRLARQRVRDAAQERELDQPESRTLGQAGRGRDLAFELVNHEPRVRQGELIARLLGECRSASLERRRMAGVTFRSRASGRQRTRADATRQILVGPRAVLRESRITGTARQLGSRRISRHKSNPSVPGMKTIAEDDIGSGPAAAMSASEAPPAATTWNPSWEKWMRVSLSWTDHRQRRAIVVRGRRTSRPPAVVADRREWPRRGGSVRSA
jgi:hypothetical protein